MKLEPLRSMQKGWLVTNQPGFSLVEAILSSAVFILLVTTLVGAYLYGQESVALAGNRARANMFAEEGLEAVRNIRDAGFSNLVNGTHGLTTTSNQWNLSGSSDTNDIFTRQVIISSIDANRKSIISTVTWQQNTQRTGTVSLTTRLTNWLSSAAPVGDCNPFAASQGYSAGTCRQNTRQCTNNGETYLVGGDAQCVTNYPGDPSHDTCCALP